MIENNEENREKLARIIVDGMDLESLIDAALELHATRLECNDEWRNTLAEFCIGFETDNQTT